MAVNGINSINFTSSPLTETKKSQQTEGVVGTFGDFLNEAINNVNSLQQESQDMTNDLAAGKTDNIHGVMIAAEKADVALQFTMQVRNKIMDAYSEIMRMQL